MFFDQNDLHLTFKFKMAKYMPIIVNFVIGGGHVELLYNQWREKMETVFLLIYRLYISGRKTFIQNQHEHGTELHTWAYIILNE